MGLVFRNLVLIVGGFVGGFAVSLILLMMGIIIGYIGHPYEKCKRMYVTAEDMSECVWLLENQPALR